MTVKPRLLLDEMLSGTIAARLRERGNDVIAVVDDRDLSGSADEVLLQFATAQKRALVTANVRDFVALHAAWTASGREHGGLTYLSSRAFPAGRAFRGAVVTAIDRMIRDGRVPAPAHDAWLAREHR